MAIYVPENAKQSRGRGQSCHPLCSDVVSDAGGCWRSSGSTGSKECRKLVSSSSSWRGLCPPHCSQEPIPLLKRCPPTAASTAEVLPAWCRAEALASATAASPVNPPLGMGSMLSHGLRHCRLVLHDHLCQAAICCLLLRLCLWGQLGSL